MNIYTVISSGQSRFCIKNLFFMQKDSKKPVVTVTEMVRINIYLFCYSLIKHYPFTIVCASFIAAL